MPIHLPVMLKATPSMTENKRMKKVWRRHIFVSLFGNREWPGRRLPAVLKSGLHAIIKLSHNTNELLGAAMFSHYFPRAFSTNRVERFSEVDVG